MAAVKRNAHHSLSVTPIKPFISYFPKDYGLTKVKRRLGPISHKFIQKLRPLLTQLVRKLYKVSCISNFPHNKLWQLNPILDNPLFSNQFYNPLDVPLSNIFIRPIFQIREPTHHTVL